MHTKLDDLLATNHLDAEKGQYACSCFLATTFRLCCPLSRIKSQDRPNTSANIAETAAMDKEVSQLLDGVQFATR